MAFSGRRVSARLSFGSPPHAGNVIFEGELAACLQEAEKHAAEQLGKDAT